MCGMVVCVLILPNSYLDRDHFHDHGRDFHHLGLGMRGKNNYNLYTGGGCIDYHWRVMYIYKTIENERRSYTPHTQTAREEQLLKPGKERPVHSLLLAGWHVVDGQLACQRATKRCSFF